VATVLMIFVRINWSNFGEQYTKTLLCQYDRYDVTLCGPHSLENMNYGQKSFLALGIFIQVSWKLKSGRWLYEKC